MINSNDMVKTRIAITGVFWLPIMAALIARFYVVQVKKHAYYLDEVEKTCTTQRKLEGRRGEICDVSGSLLVGNRPCVRISCSPHDIKPEKRRIAAEIFGKYLDKDVEYYYRRLEPMRQVRDKEGKVVMRPNQYLLLGRTVQVDTAQKMREELRHNGLPLSAFSFANTYTRVYPKKRMLANFLGYSDLENDEIKPQAGIEKGMSGKTAPQPGQIKMEISRDGVPLDYGLQNINASRDGKNIYLTVSEPIQSILEEELDAAWQELNPDAIYAVIASPDGNILAIAQRPTFDPNDRSTFSNETLRNRLVMDGFEPGSVMKPFTVAKALDWGVVTPDSRIDCEGGRWMYCGKVMTDTHHNEQLTVHEVIQKSSNIGTAKIALMLGEERLEQALTSFGFGKRTGIPLPFESAGTKPRPPKGDKLTVTRIPIGYASRVTVLQLLRAYCTLANGGRRPTLRLIDRIADPAAGSSAPEPVPEAEQLFENPRALEQLVDMLVSVTQKGGTATPAAIRGYDVAGKTGTSNKLIIEYAPGDPEPGKRRKVLRRYYSRNQYYASFAGFVPAHRPQLVMVVTVDNPRGKSHFGGSVAGPIFSRTAKRVLEHLNVPPDHPEELTDGKAKRRVAAAPRPEPKRQVEAAPRPEPKRQVTAARPERRRTAERKPAAVRPRKSVPATNRRAANSTGGRRSSGARSEFPSMTQTWDQNAWP